MKALIFFLCLIVSMQSYAQKSHKILEIDHFGNIYTVNGIELTKFSSKNKILSNFSNTLLGEISSIDVSNPLRLLLFYKESNQALYLNQNLSLIADAIDLYAYSDNETQLCCDASSGGFWIYNTFENQAFHISKQNEIINKSDLLMPYFNEAQPLKMIEYQKQLYFLIPSHGLIILNQFGHFIQEIPLPEITNFCFDNQTLLYLKNNTWFKYKPMVTTDSILFQIKDSIEQQNQSQIFDNKIYTFTNNQVLIKPIKSGHKHF